MVALQPGWRLRSILLHVSVLSVIASGSRAAGPPNDGPADRSVALFSSQFETTLRDRGIAIWGRDPGVVIVGVDEEELRALATDGVAPSVTFQDTGQWIYVLHHREDLAPPRPLGVTIHPLSPTADLYLFPAGARVELPRVKPFGGFMAIARTPLPPIEPHPADLAPAPRTGTNPLVSDILAATSQTNWFQAVKDLSGENPVVIGGSTWTILTRYSDAMFPTPADNAHATEYILDRASGWGYSGSRESYTSAESGCGGQTKAWQNVIFTLPGQVDFGQHQQVLFVNHYDSLSFSTAENFAYAPGADDAISGGVALLEALRTFKDYAFRNTIKIIFFSGEEEGICGSFAYVRQHPTRDMWRAVNMDQTAFDGDHNRWMNVYNWDSVNSPASVSLGDFFVQTNSDYGSIIDPAKIVRDTSKMCQTDHCPFWDVGVAAIAVLEDLHDNDICPCFDQTQTPTCHDTVTQIYNNELMFTQDYSWPSEKAAIATIAALADPLYVCPPSAPTPTITPGNNVLHLTWAAAPSVTHYVVERASSCADPFTPVASVTGTSYHDVDVSNGTSYAYRIRTCPNQVSSCVLASPVPGPSVVYQSGSATVTADSGDHDNIPDDCELITVQLNLLNDGNTPLTNVRLASLSSSHPAVEVASQIPQVVGPLAVGATGPVSFKFYLGRNGTAAACGDPLPFDVRATSTESPVSTRSFTLTAERSIVGGPLGYGFETDLSGWTITAGSFTRAPGGAPGSTAFSMHSRNNLNDCNAMTSPVIRPTATSTMTMWVNYGIEPGSFDRALVRAVDTRTNEKTLLVPTGAPYTTNGDQNLLCDNVGNLKGWSGNATAWRQATFNLASFAGVPIRIDVRYSTDSFFQGIQGFWFDNVQVMNATQINCDGQTDACSALPAEVSPGGSPVPFTISKNGASDDLRFSEASGATKYDVYPGSISSLRSGIYDHAAATGLCGFVDLSVGDGQVTATVLDSTIPNDAYLLAVGQNAAGEGKYGTSSAGATIPLALSSCP